MQAISWRMRTCPPTLYAVRHFDQRACWVLVLQVSNGRALVHYWYLPDSYDEWVAVDTAPAEVVPERRPKGPWKVRGAACQQV